MAIEGPERNNDKAHEPMAERQQRATGNSAPSRLSKKRETFSCVNTVLSSLVNRLELDRRLKEHAVLSLWPSVVEGAFQDKSRPLFIDHEGSLVVAVRDASTGQELSFQKTEILKKLRPMARGMGIEIKSIRFDLKHFFRREISEDAPAPAATPQAPIIGKEELESIPLKSEQLQEIADLRAALSGEPGNEPLLCDRIVGVYEREVRLKQWRRMNGYPNCPSCGEPAESFHGSDAFCRDCYFAKMSSPRDF